MPDIGDLDRIDSRDGVLGLSLKDGSFVGDELVAVDILVAVKEDMAVLQRRLESGDLRFADSVVEQGNSATRTPSRQGRR